MNIDEYRKRLGELADDLATVDGAAAKVGTLDRAQMMADMFQSDDWLELAQELCPIPKSTGSPYKRRERTRPRFAKFNAELAKKDGHQPISTAYTVNMLEAAEVLPFIKNHGQAANFSTARSVRPLVTLVRNGLGSHIPAAIDLATADGQPLTAARLKDSVNVVKRKALAGGRTYRQGADERTENAEYRAEEAFRKLLAAAKKSENGVEQVNKFIQFIKDETRQYHRAA